jgi:SAM-dependent methyltransferase
MKAFPIKLLPDGRALLNLACGYKMDRRWNNIDFSRSAYLRRHFALAKIASKFGFLNEEKLSQVAGMDPEMIYHDLRRGIPFQSESFDAVYHSHFLEHLDRVEAPRFLRECRRVLKKGGLLRVVVPDLEILVENYLDSIKALQSEHLISVSGRRKHQDAIWAIFDQFVRTKPGGVVEPINPTFQVRLKQTLIPANVTAAGELHKWIYDRYTLEDLLIECGYGELKVETATTSRIEGWSRFGLDTDSDGKVYKPESLFMECLK